VIPLRPTDYFVEPALRSWNVGDIGEPGDQTRPQGGMNSRTAITLTAVVIDLSNLGKDRGIGY
jgi:hypothetical protein